MMMVKKYLIINILQNFLINILKIMSTLNNSSPSHDNINIKMFKNVINYIITPLTYYVIYPLKMGQFQMI